MLGKLIQQTAIRGALRRLAPRSFKIPSALSVPPVYKDVASAPIIGRAFDYVMKWEISRLHPERAIAVPWILEEATVTLTSHRKKQTVLLTEFELPRHIRRTVAATRIVVNHYQKIQQADAYHKNQIIEHALRLARVEIMYRQGNGIADHLSATPTEVEKEDMRQMLALVPWEELVTLGEGPIIPGPTFGRAGALAGGADADLIVGDAIVDVSTSKKDAFDTERFNHVIAYYIIALLARALGEEIPVIRRLCTYHARHAHIHVIPTRKLHQHPAWLDSVSAFLRNGDFADALSGEISTLGKNVRLSGLYSLVAELAGDSKQNPLDDLVNQLSSSS